MTLGPYLYLLYITLLICKGALAATTFTFTNKCSFTVWAGILANSDSPRLETTGFELQSGGLRSFQAPPNWSGRLWGRTGCTFDSNSGQVSCSTGDCGSGQVECNGKGATPPATLAEFSIGLDSQDFYDVSLVDGYNLPIIVEPNGGSGLCEATGCVTDLNRQCPVELQVGSGEACKSACEAFGSEEYCCSGAYGTPSSCKPSVYSVMFKTACPRSYSYAYDDATSTFTCTGADYTITFCPSMPSQKSARQAPPVMLTGTKPESEASSTEQADDDDTKGFSNSWLADIFSAGNSSNTVSTPFLFYSTFLASFSSFLFLSRLPGWRSFLMHMPKVD